MGWLPASEAFVRARWLRVGATARSAKVWVSRICLASALGLTISADTVAEDLAIPADVEARLSAGVAAYERTLARRAGDKIVILIVTNPADSDSSRAGAQLRAAFRELDTIAGRPHEELVAPWTGSAALADECARSKPAIVFVSTGMDAVIEPLVKALENVAVLTIAGSLPYVQKGIVLGFDLVSGRPKLVINLSMARKQGLEFRAELLRLARVVQ